MVAFDNADMAYLYELLDAGPSGESASELDEAVRWTSRLSEGLRPEVERALADSGLTWQKHVLEDTARGDGKQAAKR